MKTTLPRLTVILLALVAILALGGCVPSAETLRDWLGALSGAQDTPRDPVALPTPTLAPSATAQVNPTAGQPAPGATVPPEALPSSGPFAGTFTGAIRGDDDSQAQLRLELIQQGLTVAGTATLGEGLSIDAGGFCGRFPVPASSFAAGETLPAADSRLLEARTTVDVEGFEIPLTLRATLAPDGQTMAVEATLFTPALCSNDPTVAGTLTRSP